MYPYGQMASMPVPQRKKGPLSSPFVTSSPAGRMNPPYKVGSHTGRSSFPTVITRDTFPTQDLGIP